MHRWRQVHQYGGCQDDQQTGRRLKGDADPKLGIRQQELVGGGEYQQQGEQQRS